MTPHMKRVLERLENDIAGCIFSQEEADRYIRIIQSRVRFKTNAEEAAYRAELAKRYKEQVIPTFEEQEQQ